LAETVSIVDVEGRGSETSVAMAGSGLKDFPKREFPRARFWVSWIISRISFLFFLKSAHTFLVLQLLRPGILKVSACFLGFAVIKTFPDFPAICFLVSVLSLNRLENQAMGSMKFSLADTNRNCVSYFPEI
jgi:hypothetical protein